MKRATSGSTYESIVENVREKEGTLITRVNPGEQVEITIKGIIAFAPDDDDTFSCWYVGPEPKPCGEEEEIHVSGMVYSRKTFTLESGTVIVEDLNLNYMIPLRRVVICPLENPRNPPPDSGVPASPIDPDATRSYGAVEAIPDEAMERDLLGVG